MQPYSFLSFWRQTQEWIRRQKNKHRQYKKVWYFKQEPTEKVFGEDVFKVLQVLVQGY